MGEKNVNLNKIGRALLILKIKYIAKKGSTAIKGGYPGN